MWKCIRCNKENQDTAENCVNCGHGKTMDYTGYRSVSRLRPEIIDNWKKKKEKPMLMSDYVEDNEEHPTVFGSILLRQEIKKIEFVEIDLKNVPTGAWDVSVERDKTIWVWASREAEKIVLKIGSENGVYANSNCRNLFWKYNNVKVISFNDLFDTSRVTDANGMFGNCINLTDLNVSEFQTRNIRDMAYMFLNCKSLTELNVRNFNTDSAENMAGVFRLCGMLRDLDVSSFNTSRVTAMETMFSTCESLTSLDLSGFDTGKVTNMDSMFYQCKNMTYLNVSGFDTGRVKSMRCMFYECSNLKSIDISRFNSESVEDMSYMFYNCQNLLKIDVSRFDTGCVQNMAFMFCKCKRLEELDVSYFKTGQVQDMEAMFNGCYNLRRLDVSGFNTSKVKNMSDMFSFCENLTQLDTSNFYYTANVNTKDMFKNCSDNRVQTEHISDFPSTSQELTVLNPDELERLASGSYKGNSIEELCEDFLTDSLNAQINNAGTNSKWIINALEIPSEDKIYILCDGGSSFVKFSSVGFAITDRGIYMKYAFSRKVIKTPWKKFMKAKTIKRAYRTLETDIGDIIMYPSKSESLMDKWYELRLCRLEMLFICIYKFLNANAF